MTQSIAIYLEIGQKRVFAGAIEWPGWCRSGKDEAAAQQALLEAAPRYARVAELARQEFPLPFSVAQLQVVERLPGNTTTDFGAPDCAPAADARPVADRDLKRFNSLLEACWKTFDAAAAHAAGKELRRGPRGGGRELEKILEHVVGAEGGYASALGWKIKVDGAAGMAEQLRQARRNLLEGVAASARGEIAERGPRGGLRWSPRYAVRRIAWHVLDHAWEIEDRVV
jgi:hypothetical protein